VTLGNLAGQSGTSHTRRGPDVWRVNQEGHGKAPTTVHLCAAARTRAALTA
jgi:hypothetical protein